MRCICNKDTQKLGGKITVVLVVINIRRSLLRVVLGLSVLMLAVTAVAGGSARAVMSAVSTRLVPIYRVAREDKAVSVTVDATWGDDQTIGLLDLFDEFGIRTTFFLAGNWIKSYPDKVRLIAQRGHELGNHSLTHPNMSALTEAQIRRELNETGEMIRTLVGKTPSLFRPPFGDYNNKVLTVAEQCGYKTIQWSIDSLDWKNLSAEEIHRRVMARMHNGAIILFHNAGKGTPGALRLILTDLKRQGYVAVPVSELLLEGEYYIDRSTGEQRPVRRRDPAEPREPRSLAAIP